jgi:formylglycine-generating enzyme required for sulfatase activity
MKRLILFLTAFVLFVGTGPILGAEKKIEKKPTQKSSDPQEAKATETTYHALIIGNNQYKYLPKLKTARNDAIEVEKLLREKFKFQTEILLDATRASILGKINEMRKRLEEKDSLLIYYAGHGEYDRTVDKAYWLPVDAQKDDPTNWIMADDITSNIKRIAARHVLVVSDSCYSGTLGRQAVTELITTGGREGYLKKMMERPSRTLMASGGNEPVSDSGGGNNSIFTVAFLKSLKEIEKDAFTAEEIFHTRIKEIVAGKSDQVPEYGNIKNSGHEGGDFVFILAKMKVEPLQTAEPIKVISKEETDQMQKERQKLAEERARLEADRKKLEEEIKLEVERAKLAEGKALLEAKEKETEEQLRKQKEAQEKLAEEQKSIAEQKKLAEEKKKSEEESARLEEEKKKLKEGTKPTQQSIAMAPQPSQVPKEPPKRISNSIGMELVLILPGNFMMGGEEDPESVAKNSAYGVQSKVMDIFYRKEHPQHRVTLTKPFYLQKTEVTVEQFRRFADESGYKTDAEREGWGMGMDIRGNSIKKDGANWKAPGFKQNYNEPVPMVSWNDAVAFISWLNKKEGTGKYRLPTEAEWEYSCRAGTDTPFYWGRIPSGKYANFKDVTYAKAYPKDPGGTKNVEDGYVHAAPVGSFLPNNFGLYDMSGNVQEWCQDWFGEYQSGQFTDPTGPSSGYQRVLRGGSWYLPASWIRSAFRRGVNPETRSQGFGFRVARDY